MSADGGKMDRDKLAARFETYSDVIETGQDQVHILCMNLALTLNDILPEGREKSLVFTKIEEAMQWGVAALTRNF